MHPRTVTLFFALLAIAAIVVVLGAAVLALLAPRSSAVAHLRARWADEVRPAALPFAAGVATVATLGSLYLSEVAGFRPCSLCWVQRGFMYPLAAVLWVVARRGGDRVRRGARTWALAGAAVSAWHVSVERFPSLEGAVACDPLNPCSLRWVEHLGFVTIPVMALAAFSLAAVLLSVRPRSSKPNAPAEPEMSA